MVSMEPCRLTDPADYQALVELALSTFGRVDVLFNLAAMQYFNWLEDITDEEWDRAYLYLTQHGFETAFAGDVPKTVADQMWAGQRPFSQAAFESLSAEAAWKTIPSWYLVATQDHAIPPATQRFMAARAHATIAQIKGSHVPMISQLRATTNVIHRASKAAG
jgi:pimeloyl-ACP methyl ester carboxylesterase